MSTTPDQLPDRRHRASAGPLARSWSTCPTARGSKLALRQSPNPLGDATVRMLAYNGSIPGPTLKVREGSETTVDIENRGDVEDTVHWHGLRLENRYDGTHQTQSPIAFGERFSAVLSFPDPGVYWYHLAHARGLRPGDAVPQRPWSRRTRTTGPPRTASLALTLDDILLEDGKVAPSVAARRRTPPWAASATCCS